MESGNKNEEQKKDPAQDSNVLKSREDKRTNNIDGKISIKEMREGAEKEEENAAENGPEDDAMNYKNDRENGAYNPKNI